jgi:hypothetical protein
MIAHGLCKWVPGNFGSSDIVRRKSVLPIKPFVLFCHSACKLLSLIADGHKYNDGDKWIVTWNCLQEVANHTGPQI